MAKLNTEAKTRADYQREILLDAGVDEELAEAWAGETVEKEDERIWAFYRDPETDLSQVEARDRAQNYDYPPSYQLSQSGVSRRISDLDDAILSEPLQLLKMSERPENDPESEHRLAGFLARADVQNFERYFFEEYLDAYRRTIAKFLVDLEALSMFKDFEQPTPGWAKSRFEDLNPDVGREFAEKTGIDADLHEPADN